MFPPAWLADLVRACEGVSPKFSLKETKALSELTTTRGDEPSEPQRWRLKINRKVLQCQIFGHVAHGSKILHYQASIYTGTPKEYTHDFVNHMEKHVDGRVHTNGLDDGISV